MKGDGAGLSRTLDLPMVFAIALKQVIGGGVIVLTGTAVSLTGAGAGLAYGLACAVVLLVSLPYAVLGAAVPVSGSLYRWPSRFIGPRAGFMAFWLVLATQVGLAAYARTFGEAVHALLPSVPGRAAGLGALGFVLLVNIWGTEVAARVEIAAVAVTASSLVGLAVAGLPHVEAARLVPLLPHGWSGLASAAALLTFPLTGATLVSELGGEMRRPGRDIPLAILGATAAAAGLYLAVAVVAAGVPGVAGRPLDAVSAAVMGPDGRVLFGLGAGVVSMLGITNAHMLWGSRSVVMVSRDGWLPGVLAWTGRSGAPVGALLLLTAIGVMPLAAGLDVADIIRVAGLGATVSAILSVTCAGIFGWRERAAYAASPLALPLPWLLTACVAAVATQTAVLVWLAGDLPSRLLMGFAGWVVLGVVIVSRGSAPGPRRGQRAPSREREGNPAPPDPR